MPAHEAEQHPEQQQRHHPDIAAVDPRRQTLRQFRIDPGHAAADLRRALGLWRNEPALFRQVVLQGMACDYSWNHPGQRYLDLYEFIRHK